MKQGTSRGKRAHVATAAAYRTRSMAPVAVPDKKTDMGRRLQWAKTALLIFASAIIPLIVFLKSYDLHGILITAWTGGLEHIDFFNWWKAVCLILVFVILLAINLVQLFAARNTLQMPRLFLPLILFEVFAVLSAISSTVPEIAFRGFVDRSEGLWVLLSYGMLCYTAFSVSKDTKTVRIVLTAIFCGSLAVAAIGLFQFLGFDFFQTDFGKRLILPKVYEQFMNQLTFNFGRNIMYTTVYNPNYLGSYASLLLPVAWGLTFSWAESGKRGNGRLTSGKDAGKTAVNANSKAVDGFARYFWIFGIISASAIFVLWLGSMSRAGLLGGTAAMLLFLLLQAKTIVRNPIPAFLLLVVMAVTYLFMNTASGGLVANEFQKTLPSRIQQALGEVPATEEAVKAPPEGLSLPEGVPAVPPDVKAVSLKDNRFKFTTETETLQMVMEKTTEGTLHFFDANSSPLALLQSGTDSSSQTFADKRYAAYRITVKNGQYTVFWYQYSFLFTNATGILTYAPKPNTLWTDMEPAPFIGFLGHERFATNRGWIWSRTFPILGKAIFTGYGPDTFAVFFPQKDIAWKINLYGASNIVVDKPHNWYLQTAVNTGIVSLLLLLWFLGGFLLDGIRTRFGKPGGGMEALFGEAVAGDKSDGKAGDKAGDKSGDKAGDKAGSKPGDKSEDKAADKAGDKAAGKAGGKPGAGIVSDDGQSLSRNVLLTGILCGAVGYILAGVFNDSVVSVAPVFWTVIGLGIGMISLSTQDDSRANQDDANPSITSQHGKFTTRSTARTTIKGKH